MSDPYSILGVQRGATAADIKKAYRTLAKTLHPDTNQNNPKAADRFAQVTQAYDLLSDATKRAQFDRGEIDGQGQPRNPFAGSGGGGNPFGGGAGPQGFDVGDMFEGLFGGARARGQGGGFGGFGGAGGGGGRATPQKGANVAYRLNVPFIDAATLTPQRITLKDGKTIDLKLSAGVESGTQMKLSGKGDPGPGGAGDAIVTIQISPHAHFIRDGDNVRLNLPISLVEAVKGGPVRVPTVDGAVMLKVPAGATSGQVMRLKGKGFTRKSGERGDQLVTLMIDLPKDDAALISFAESWSDSRDIRADMA